MKCVLSSIKVGFFFTFSLWMISACDLGKRAYEQLAIDGATMGTFYTVKLVHEKDETSPDAERLKQIVDALLVEINRSMSTYLPDSELSKINRLEQEVEALPISDGLFEVLELSQKISEKSLGAFDVTVSPLVELWGFGASEQDRQQVPTEEAIHSALANIGYQKLVLDATNKQLSRPEGLSIDLSAVAKGYAVDQVAKQLAALGYANFMVEIGGEVRARGVNQRGLGWHIGVETPAYSLMAAPQGPALVVQLDDKAMATSGDYRNYYEVDGQRFSHTIDPKTGRPITHHLASVTVIADDCASSDAWATAFNVMGAEAALELADRLNIAAFFIVKTPQGFDTLSSKAFADYQK